MGDPDKFEFEYGIFRGIAFGAAFHWSNEEYRTWHNYYLSINFLCFYFKFDYNRLLEK